MRITRKIISIVLLMALIPNAMAVDLIVTKQNKKFRGTLQKRTPEGFVINTVEGTIVVLPQNEISKIIREDNSIWDFETRTRYYLRKSRPFLPFAVLGVAAGAYSYTEFRAFQEEQDRVKEKEEESGEKYTGSRSMKYLALCIVSGLFSVGSFYMAFKPLEVKIPLGRINLTATEQGITLAFHF